ncbi:TIGR04563 family protein [Persicimonas caeni]|uniref:TIGR04563 family protein n=1 Tax=Persicimonas caeni TaxID=2292766 RepID=A0A4Y6Q206_PERCE|nr:TIGR04563 family protein [Persicimonas caeni]QDG54596.1 TIGR04563 family protein [Persicimonas caeni]QED35817.1 TIGR04563 family protein [Persicimonas caeni]
MASKKKLTLYFPENLVNETKREALRHDRSMSWIIEMAWRIAREQIESMPGVVELQEGNWEGAAE